MTNPPQEPILDFIPPFPAHRPLGKAWVRWWKETWGWFKHTVAPTEMALPEPKKIVAPPTDQAVPCDLAERLTVAKAMVDSAEKRLETVRSKATSLLGFVALLTPILSWWLLTGRERIGVAPIPLAVIVYGLMVLATASLMLCFRALFRSQSVATFPTQTPSLFVDLDKGELKPHDWAGELIGQLEAWGSVHRWADVVTDYFRAGQRFLGISLVAGVAAGVISFLYPQPNKTITLIARPTGELAIQGSFGPSDPNADITRWEEAIWYIISLAAIGSIVFFLTRYRYRPDAHQRVKFPECKNIVRLTPTAAAKVREFMTKANSTYLCVSAMQNGLEPVVHKVDVISSFDPETHLLGESEGVQIVISHVSAGLLKLPIVNWVEPEQGGSGFRFESSATGHRSEL